MVQDAYPTDTESAPERDPYASIEMYFPQRHGELPEVAGANPEFGSAAPGQAQAGASAADAWGSQPIYQGGSNRAMVSGDPWASAVDRPQMLGSAYGAAPRVRAAVPKKRVVNQRFAATDVVTIAGVVLLYISLMLPWAELIPVDEGPTSVTTAGSFPLTFLISGFQEDYALPWLTAFTLLAVTGLAAALGTVISERPSSYLMVSAAGIVALLTPAAFLVKLATLQEEVELQGGFSHGIGLYIAIGAGLVILVGATLRSNRIKST